MVLCGVGRAADGEHWSLQPVKDPKLPVVSKKDWPRNPIDAFILAKLQAAGLEPSPAADRVTRIRRLYLDVHGLPPTPPQIERFINDRQPGAYERLVDRVLASPRYGERWARHWLDLARFAETHGFERNLERPLAWPYRDYVIAALNDDKPYDRFIFEQLAGDSVGVDAATGFLVAGPFDDVKSREIKFQLIQRQDELADMINATGTAFLGLTLGCARCHTHKFDPITHKDYYALQAVLAGVQHGDRPLKSVDERKHKQRLTLLEQKIAALEKQLGPYKLRLREPVNPEQNTEEFAPLKARAVRFTVLETSDGAGPAIDELELWSPGPTEAEAMKMYARKTFDVGDLRSATLTVTCDDHCVVWLNGKKVAATDSWPNPAQVDVKTALRKGKNVLAVDCLDDKKPAGLLLRLSMVLADGRRQFVVTDETWRQTVKESQGWKNADFDDTHWPTAVSLGKLGVAPWGNVFAKLKNEPSGKDVRAPSWIWTGGGRNLALGAKVSASGSLSDNPLRHKLEFINDGRYGDAACWISDQDGKGWVQLDLPAPAVIGRIVWGRDRTQNYADRIPTKYRVEVAVEPGKWRQVAGSEDRLPFGIEKNERLRYRTTDLAGAERQRVDGLISELLAFRARRDDLLTMPTAIYAGKFEQPGVTRRLARGDPAQPRDAVGPNTVSALGNLHLTADAPEQNRRIALARWIIDPSNPLTARVMVNRIWQHHFGTGIVDTPSDFGKQGSKPTHPELLDWLASRFVESGWSLKHVHRLILTSSTYRQAGAPSQRGLKADADSRLLWRYPPHRLEAEPIRDSILAVSGVLDLKMGGPGFSPFKPTQHHVRSYVPKEREGPEDWRRMVYMTKVRMEHDAVFGAFDDPDAGLVCPKRSRSTTPIQAFNLLNSDFMMQQSELFARRLKREAGEATADQVNLAFRLAFGRAPDLTESTAASKLVRTHGLPALCLALFNANELAFVP
jgi:hypothetical protein